MKFFKMVCKILFLTIIGFLFTERIQAADKLPSKKSVLKPATKILLIKKDGTEKKFPSAQKALDQAEPGDTVLLGPGLHRGPLKFTSSGKPGQPIILKGEKGAFVNANIDWKPVWTAVPEIGPRIYSTPLAFNPYSVNINDHFGIRVQMDSGLKRHGVTLLAALNYGIGLHGLTTLGALTYYDPEKSRLLVSLAKGKHPKDQKIEVCPHLAAITVDGQKYCEIEGLVITGGKYGILLTNAHNVIIRNCLVYSPGWSGIHVEENSSNCQILHCDVTMNPFSFSIDCLPRDVMFEIFKVHKSYKAGNTNLVSFYGAGPNNVCAYNYLYNGFNGVQDIFKDMTYGQIEEHWKKYVLKGKSVSNVGLKVHHNRLDLLIDDALEPIGDGVDNEWYSNHISRVGCAVRLKSITMGPFYFYNNIIELSEDGLRFFKTSHAKMYIYHNLIFHPWGISYCDVKNVRGNHPWLAKLQKRGIPNTHLYNNLFICKNILNNSQGVKPDYKSSYNFYTCNSNKELTELGLDKNSIFATKPVFEDEKKQNFHLKPESPGVGKGLDLSKFEIDLPGCEKKYFPGKQPDLGLIRSAQEKTPQGPTSGLWEMATKFINLGERPVAEFPIESTRWIRARKILFVLKGISPNKAFRLRMVRHGGRSLVSQKDYHIRVMDANKKVLLEQKGKENYYVEQVILDVPATSNTKTIYVAIDNPEPNIKGQVPSGSSWRFDLDDPNIRIGFKADKWVQLVSRDYGAPYILEVVAEKGDGFFKVEDECLRGATKPMRIYDPNGRQYQIEKDGKVLINDLVGTYRIFLYFTKRMNVKLSGIKPIFYFSRKQDGETAFYKPRWGKKK